MNGRYRVGNLSVTALHGWSDITDYSDESMPFTLAKESGMGAFQISGADYKAGEKPEVTLNDLIELREAFVSGRFSGEGFDELLLNGVIMVAGKSYHEEDDYIRIWYCSDGASIFLITYLSSWGSQGCEPEECERMVVGISFGSGG